MGKPWSGDYVFSSGDLIEDLTHNFFLETGARSNKLQGLRDGRPPGGTGADRLPARPRRRAPGRLRAGAREPHRRGSDEALPLAADPDRPDPRVPAAHRGVASTASSTASPRPTTRRSSRCSRARTRRPARSSRSSTRRPRASPAARPARRSPAPSRPDYAPEEIAEIAAKGLRQKRRPLRRAHGRRRERRLGAQGPRGRCRRPRHAIGARDGRSDQAGSQARRGAGPRPGRPRARPTPSKGMFDGERLGARRGSSSACTRRPPRPRSAAPRSRARSTARRRRSSTRRREDKGRGDRDDGDVPRRRGRPAGRLRVPHHGRGRRGRALARSSRTLNERARERRRSPSSPTGRSRSRSDTSRTCSTRIP